MFRSWQLLLPAILLILTACTGGGTPDPLITGVTPATVTIGLGATVTVQGEGFYSLPARGLTVHACGATLAAVELLDAQPRPLVSAPGVVVTADVASGLRGQLGAGATTGLSDVTVVLPAGERLVLSDALECVDPSGSAVVTITPETVSALPGAELSFSATVSGTDEQGVTWTLSGAADSVLEPDGTDALLRLGSGSEPHFVTATSVADPGVSATAEVTVLDRMFDLVTVPADGATVSGLAAGSDGPVAVALITAAGGEVLIHDPASGRLSRHAGSAFDSYLARPFALTWAGDSVLVVGESGWHNDAAGFIASIDPDVTAPTVSWLQRQDSRLLGVGVRPDGERVVAGRDFAAALLPGTLVPEDELWLTHLPGTIAGLQVGADGTVYLWGEADGFVAALTGDLSGTLWVETMPVAGIAALEDGVLVAGGQQARRLSDTGAVLWEYTLPGTAVAVAAAAEFSYVVTADGELLKLDGNGEQVWSYGFAADLQVSHLVVAANGSLVVTGSSSGEAWLGWLVP